MRRQDRIDKSREIYMADIKCRVLFLWGIWPEYTIFIL